MSKSIVDFITSVLVLYCVPLVWIGRIRSKYLTLSLICSHTFHRIKEKLRSGEMAISGDNWPVFLYHGYNYDPEDPWNGLFRSTILVMVSNGYYNNKSTAMQLHYQAYKHIFTSPSSVEKEPKATRSGNARIHGMTRVTLPSIAYVATQVSRRFCTSVFPPIIIPQHAGPIRAVFLPSFFQNRYSDRLREIL